jgi:hypothetical protein
MEIASQHLRFCRAVAYPDIQGTPIQPAYLAAQGSPRNAMAVRILVGALLLFSACPMVQVGWAKPICVPTPIPGSRMYQNSKYQFAVKIPQHFHACMISSPCPNHGIWLPLKGDSECKKLPTPPYVDIDAEYNAAEVADTAGGLAAVQCHYRGPTGVVWLTRERLGGREAVGCRRDFPDGRVEVTILTLRRTATSPGGWIEVSADLVTTPDRYRTDRRAYRQILRGLWVHPDGPDD